MKHSKIMCFFMVSVISSVNPTITFAESNEEDIKQNTWKIIVGNKINDENIAALLNNNSKSVEQLAHSFVNDVFEEIDKFRSKQDKDIRNLDNYKKRLEHITSYPIKAYRKNIEIIGKMFENDKRCAEPESNECVAAKKEVEEEKKVLLSESVKEIRKLYEAPLTDLTKALSEDVNIIPGWGKSEGETPSNYYFYFGNVSNLNSKGDWSSKVEFAFTSETIRHKGKKWDHISWNDMTFTTISQKQNDEGGSVTSPFTKDSGIVRYQGAFELVCNKSSAGCYPGLGIVAGLGLTSFPSSEEVTYSDSFNFSQLRGKVFAGVTFRNKYTKGGIARTYVVYAYDDFWRWKSVVDGVEKEYKYRDRVVFDGRLEFPGVFKSKSVSLMIRSVLDYSTHDKGPSDVRISFLANTNLSTLFSL